MLGDCAPPQVTAAVLSIDFTTNPFDYKPLGHNRAISLVPIDQTQVEATTPTDATGLPIGRHPYQKGEKATPLMKVRTPYLKVGN